MKTARLAWHHFIFEVPDTWEVFRYRNHYPEGGLGLMDRFGETMQIFWRLTRAKPPARDRLVDQVVALGGHHLEAEDVRKLITRRHGWEVFLPDDPAVPALAARCEPHGPAPGHPADAAAIRRRYGEYVMLFAVFPPRAIKRDRAVVPDVLKSYRPNYAEERVWAAFGLNITLPQHIVLDRLEPLPTSQVFRFENRAGESVTLQRLALYPEVLGSDTPAVLAARLKGRRYRLFDDGEFVKDGRWSGRRMRYTTRGRGGIGSMTASVWQGRMWAWGCDDLHRFYCLDNHAREKNLIPDLPERVVCWGAPEEPPWGGMPPANRQERRSATEVLDQQLRSVPVVNPVVRSAPAPEGRVRLAAPVARKWWVSAASGALRLPERKVLELDPIGAEVFDLLDGRRTIEEIIDAHRQRWALTFLEARGMILEYLRRLMRRRLVLIRTPEGEEKRDRL